MISGTILIEKPSLHNIHKKLITENSQKDLLLQMKKTSMIAIDEHIIQHSSNDIEGVDYFYSTTKNGKKLVMSLIMGHYYHKNIK
ncbi:MAG: hypothetical protein K9W44_15170 [Candidatus Lokiarchaeota archaeon]|nr:hypothetical protein [Candidatus Harpocratesius repetitus]